MKNVISLFLILLFSMTKYAVAAVNAVPAWASADVIIRADLRGQLRTLLEHGDYTLEHGDYTSAKVRIFGQVPPAVWDANLSVRRDYEKYLDLLLLKFQVDGAIRGDVNIGRFRLMLIGALNATTEWFDPAKGSAEELADNYADAFLSGVLNQTRDPS